VRLLFKPLQDSYSGYNLYVSSCRCLRNCALGAQPYGWSAKFGATNVVTVRHHKRNWFGLALAPAPRMATNVNPYSGACVLPLGADLLADVLYLKNHRRSDLTMPEKALLFAVLAEAVETYQKNAFSKLRRRQIIFREVEEWFFGKAAGHLFSFPTVCEVLGFDAAFLRRGLMQWKRDRRHRRPARKAMQVHSVRSSRRKLINTVNRVASTISRPDAFRT